MVFSISKPKPVGWQATSVLFDLSPRLLRLADGEMLIDSINSVEDTKGNNGIRGSLTVTNLRLIWVSHELSRINLSIGHGCVQSYYIQAANSKLRGKVQALFTRAKHDDSRYEFIFTSLVNASPRLFVTTQAVYRAFDSSKFYRELKLRGAIVREGKLSMLPDEHVYEKLEGIMNLSSEQGNMGCGIVTNLRFVWFATLAHNFNVSVPYLQIQEIKTRKSKFGNTLVLRTVPGYVLGFQVEPIEKLTNLAEMLNNLHKTFLASPNYGVKFTIEEKPQSLDKLTVQRTLEQTEIVNDEEAYGISAPKRNAIYAVMNQGGGERKPCYNKSLGLAVEELPEGVTIESIWKL